MKRFTDYFKKHLTKNNLAAIIAALGLVGPDILNQLNLVHKPWLRAITIPVAYIISLCVKGKAVILLDLFFKKEEPKKEVKKTT
jgi:hypothetical protein